MNKPHEPGCERRQVKRRIRCGICDWPLRDTLDQGCVDGNCSERGGGRGHEARRIARHKSNRRSGNDRRKATA